MQFELHGKYSCLCAVKWMGDSVCVEDLLKYACRYQTHSIYTYTCACVCVVMWLQDCCETALVSLACQLTPSALHMKGPGCVGGQEKERRRNVEGNWGTVVYLSPPCRNLYHTLSALIKDHSVLPPSLLLSRSLIVFWSLTYTHAHRFNTKMVNLTHMNTQVRHFTLHMCRCPHTYDYYILF